VSLRIKARPKRGDLELPGMGGGEADGWASRVAKLIPAEALGLYGTATGMIAGNANIDPTVALAGVTVVCCVVTVMVRLKATRDPAEGRGPQVAAIVIALVSFLLWLAALGATGEGVSPFSGAPGIAYAPLVALLWGTLVPYFYKGE
jgi:hypothetical protein